MHSVGQGRVTSQGHGWDFWFKAEAKKACEEAGVEGQGSLVRLCLLSEPSSGVSFETLSCFSPWK